MIYKKQTVQNIKNTPQYFALTFALFWNFCTECLNIKNRQCKTFALKCKNKSVKCTDYFAGYQGLNTLKCKSAKVFHISGGGVSALPPVVLHQSLLNRKL
jgi:hypothetical protein